MTSTSGRARDACPTTATTRSKRRNWAPLSGRTDAATKPSRGSTRRPRSPSSHFSCAAAGRLSRIAPITCTHGHIDGVPSPSRQRTPDDERAAPIRLGGHLLQQAGLAHPGLALDEHERRAHR